MTEYQLEIKQIVEFPRCRIYKEFVEMLMCDPDIKTSSYSKTHFKMPTYPILVSVVDFSSTGYDNCRYYPETITINGDEYRVCSQWVPERIAELKAWYASL